MLTYHLQIRYSILWQCKKDYSFYSSQVAGMCISGEEFGNCLESDQEKARTLSNPDANMLSSLFGKLVEWEKYNENYCVDRGQFIWLCFVQKTSLREYSTWNIPKLNSVQLSQKSSSIGFNLAIENTSY